MPGNARRILKLAACFGTQFNLKILSTLNEKTLQLKVGEKVSLNFIHEVLEEYRFKLVDFVSEPGDFALRGSIIDIFSLTLNILLE